MLSEGNSRVPNLLLTLGSFAVAILLGECFLRLMHFHPLAEITQLDALVGWSLRPGAEGVETKEGVAHVRINSAGFRDREHDLGKPAGVYRIAMLGDSYVFGVGVEAADRVSDVLEQRLSGCPSLAGRKVEVLNFGVAGYGPGQEMIVAERRALPYRPDVLVQAFVSGNDVGDSYKPSNEGSLERPYFVYRSNGLVEDDTFRSVLPASLPSGPSLTHRLRALSALTDMLVRVWSRSRNRKELAELRQIERERREGVPARANMVMLPPQNEGDREAWRVVDALLLRTAGMAHGARYLLVEIPTEIQAHPDARVRAAFAARIQSAHLDYPTRHLGEFASANQIDFLPLTETLRAAAEARHAPVYGFDGSGFGHWNAAGHRAAGEALATRLCADAGAR